MPSQYRRDVPRLKGEIVARVAAGARLKAICAGAGMPCRQTVSAWARADEAFGAALAAAAGRAVWQRRRFDEAKAAAFLARARAGETINSRLREAGMPSRRDYNHWKAIEAPFAEAIFALRLRRDELIGAHGRARLRAFDPALADRIVVGVNRGAKLEDVLAADPQLPCKRTLRRWRREQPAFDQVLRWYFAAWRKKRGRDHGLTPEVGDAVFDRIVEGGSFASIGREPGMPSRQTLRRWNAVHPAFAETVALACEYREDWFDDQIEEVGRGCGSMTAAKRATGQLRRQLVRLRHRPGAVHRRRKDGDQPPGA